MKDSLYFIAIIPPAELQNEITQIKNEFAANFSSRHALKTFPHITLQPPFRLLPEQEVEIHLQLQEFFSDVKPFKVVLKNFGCFDRRKSKVIYISVEHNKTLALLHGKLVHFLRKELKFSDKEASYMFHPHITIAHRDLSDNEFEQAWKIYKDKIFCASFIVSTIELLKHNYRQWQVLGEYRIG